MTQSHDHWPNAAIQPVPLLKASGEASLQTTHWHPLVLHIKSGSHDKRAESPKPHWERITKMLVDSGLRVVEIAWARSDEATELGSWRTTPPWTESGATKADSGTYGAVLVSSRGLSVADRDAQRDVPTQEQAGKAPQWTVASLLTEGLKIPWLKGDGQVNAIQNNVIEAVKPYLTFRTLKQMCEESCLLSNHASELAEAAFTNKNVVLEGVAGIGKTHGLARLCCNLHRLSVPRSCKEWINKLAEFPDDPKNYRDWLDQSLKGPEGESKRTKQDGDREAVQQRLAAEVLAAVGDIRSHTVTTIVLHPSSSYEDLVIGLRPRGAGRFDRVPGPLLQAIMNAQMAYGRLEGDGARNYTTPHVIILDEINRCNLPSVLGELMLVLDPSKRVTESLFTKDFNEFQDSGREEAVRRGYAVKLLSEEERKLLSEEERGSKKWDGLLWVPDNVYVIGTMNSSDRSILGFDQALRRRFPPIRLEPHSNVEWCTQLQEWVKASPDLEANLKVAYEEIVAWAAINVMLRARIGPDAMIGHSYIYEALEHRNESEPNLRAAFERMWQYGILPQVIHSAESSRQIDFACHMFNKKESLKFFDEDAAHAIAETHIRKAIEAVLGASANFDNFKSLCGIAGVAGASPCRQHRLVVVGQGHGRRLLVERGSAGPDGIEKWCKQLAKSPFSWPRTLAAGQSKSREVAPDVSAAS